MILLCGKNVYTFSCYVQIGWPLKLSLAHGVVCGMDYLHSCHPPVIHSDLKTENILVSDTFVAKVCYTPQVHLDMLTLLIYQTILIHHNNFLMLCGLCY